MARYGDLDELRELIASFTGMFTDEGFMIDYHAVLRAIDDAEDVDVAPKSEWISVEDDRPKNSLKRVQVFLQDVDIAHNIGFPKVDTDRYADGKWVRWGRYVTHWMPLPEPPTEKEN